MEEVLRIMNKRMLAEATGMNYKRLRNLASGFAKLSKEDIEPVKAYLEYLIKEIEKDYGSF